MATPVSLRCRLEAGAQGAQQGEDGTIEGRTNTLAIRRAHHGPGDVLVLKRMAGEPVVEHRRSRTLIEPALGVEYAPASSGVSFAPADCPTTTASARSFWAISFTAGSRSTP